MNQGFGKYFKISKAREDLIHLVDLETFLIKEGEETRIKKKSSLLILTNFLEISGNNKLDRKRDLIFSFKSILILWKL